MSESEMYRIRVKYAKQHSIRFLSHLEIIRALERAVRRAQLPLAFTQGFSPHPRISYGPALSVGISSQAEFMDLILTENVPGERLYDLLHQYLPQGLEVFAVKCIPVNSSSLTKIIDVANYEVTIRGAFSRSEPERYLKSFGREKIVVERKIKGRTVSFNLFDRLISLYGKVVSDSEMILDIISRIGNNGALKPEEVVEAFSRFCGVDLEILNIRRTGLFVEHNGEYADPLDI
jgi:radical SAM-linked protein